MTSTDAPLVAYASSVMAPVPTSRFSRVLAGGLEGFGILLATWPLGILALLYAYVVRARLAVGYWPHPYRPQSHRLGFDSHYMLLRPWILVAPLGIGRSHPSPWTGLVLLVPAAIYTGACALVLGIAFRRFPVRLAAVFAISCLVNFVCWFTDPGDFIRWFQD